METITVYSDNANIVTLQLTSGGTVQNLSAITRFTLSIGGTVLDSATDVGVFDWTTDPTTLSINLATGDIQEGRYDNCALVLYDANHPSGFEWFDTLTVFAGVIPSGSTVGDLLGPVVSRLKVAPSMSLVEAVNTVSGIIFRRLMRRKSDLIRGNTTLSLAAGKGKVPLAPNFRGLVDAPCLIRYDGSDAFQPLYGAHLQDVAYYSGVPNGVPEKYQLNGHILSVFPASEKAAGIHVTYWQFPDVVTGMTSMVPFDGLFDDIYLEAVPRVALLGAAASVADQALVALLAEGIDSIIGLRPAKQVSFYHPATGRQLR
jgi:hypothetical protein